MPAEITFLGQFQLELAVCIGKLPMLAHQVMKHIGPGVVHALQKCRDSKYQQRNLA
jgi:hypothetical protein